MGMGQCKEKQLLSRERLEGLFRLRDELAVITEDNKLADGMLLNLLSMERDELIVLREALSQLSGKMEQYQNVAAAV